MSADVDALDAVARVRDLLTRALQPVLDRADALLVVELTQRVLPRADVERLGELLGEAERLGVARPDLYRQLRRRACRVLSDVLALPTAARVRVTASLHSTSFGNLHRVAERLKSAH